VEVLGHDHDRVDVERMVSFDLSHGRAQHIKLFDQQRVVASVGKRDREKPGRTFCVRSPIVGHGDSASLRLGVGIDAVRLRLTTSYEHDVASSLRH